MDWRRVLDTPMNEDLRLPIAMFVGLLGLGILYAEARPRHDGSMPWRALGLGFGGIALAAGLLCWAAL